MKYYLKKFIPVYTANNDIFIGFSDNQQRLIKIENTPQNISKLNKVINEGIDEIDFEDNIYSLLNDKNFLGAKNINENRNELFLNYIADIGLIESEKSTPILIFGAGAGGGTLTYLLAQFGFNNLTSIDFDIVNESDIYRVTIFDKTDVGKYKVLALQGKIKRNFGINIKTNITNSFQTDEIEKLINLYSPEFIIKACDPDLLFRVNLNKICFKLKINYFNIAYSYELLNIGPLYVPDFTSCDEGFNQIIKKAYDESHDFSAYKKLFKDCLIHPSVSFNINLLANYALKEIIFFITRQYEYCFSIGRLITLNPLSLQYHFWDITCNDDCKICQSKQIKL